MYQVPPYFSYNTFNPINVLPQFDRSFILEDELRSIRNSNTIFSTMVCPKCGERLVFDIYTTDEFMAYCPNDDYKLNITIKGLITLLNNNGLNWMVTPPKLIKTPEEIKQCEDVPPPDGFKVEPTGDD